MHWEDLGEAHIVVRSEALAEARNSGRIPGVVVRIWVRSSDSSTAVVGHCSSRKPPLETPFLRWCAIE